MWREPEQVGSSVQWTGEQDTTDSGMENHNRGNLGGDTQSLFLPRTLQLGAACAAPPAWAKWDGVLLYGLQVAGANHDSYL